MFLDAFKITISAMSQIFLLGAIGYFLVKKNVFGQEGLRALSHLVIKITLPILIFCQLVKDFKFNLYPNWWIFPLMSIAITILGLLIGFLFSGFINGHQRKIQFLSLITFQNSGYLPLALGAALLPKHKADILFIYLFLFLLGFNVLMWSLGVYMLSRTKTENFDLGSLSSPPVIATLFSLIIIFFGLNKFVPEVMMNPLGLIGNCTFPLAMFIVGGNLAQMRFTHFDKRAIFWMALAKLILMPSLGLWLIVKFRYSGLMGLLILMQLAMPPATSLSVIAKHYQKEDLLISQGIFFGHIISLVTLPVFLSLYLTFYPIQ